MVLIESEGIGRTRIPPAYGKEFRAWLGTFK
jgi:hypothetical protein